MQERWKVRRIKAWQNTAGIYHTVIVNEPESINHGVYGASSGVANRGGNHMTHKIKCI